jgi:hypothetical protein
MISRTVPKRVSFRTHRHSTKHRGRTGGPPPALSEVEGPFFWDMGFLSPQQTKAWSLEASPIPHLKTNVGHLQQSQSQTSATQPLNYC